MKTSIFIFFFLYFFSQVNSVSPVLAAEPTVLIDDTVWSGEVLVSEDVLVLPGVTLTISGGARVIVSPSESTQTQPEFLSPLTEITVRGALVVDGSAEKPVVIEMAATAAAGCCDHRCCVRSGHCSATGIAWSCYCPDCGPWNHVRDRD